MKTTIYQAPVFRETAFGFNPDASYRIVWQEESEGRTLDEVWTRFQRIDPEESLWPPPGYTGRSLSIGDVIGREEPCDPEESPLLGYREQLYTVEGVGFRRLNHDERLAVYRAVLAQWPPEQIQSEFDALLERMREEVG